MIDRKRGIVLGAAVLVLVLAGAGAGIARAVSGDDEQVTGPAAERASTAALDAAGGGTVLEVERQDDDGAGAYEVEVRRSDGSEVEVHLDAAFQPVGSVPDDDNGSEGDGAEADDDGS